LKVDFLCFSVIKISIVDFNSKEESFMRGIGHPFDFKKKDSRDFHEVSNKLGLLQRFILENQNKMKNNSKKLTKIDQALNGLADELRSLALD
jgi:hypothetical protein